MRLNEKRIFSESIHLFLHHFVNLECVQCVSIKVVDEMRTSLELGVIGHIIQLLTVRIHFILSLLLFSSVNAFYA